MQALSFQWAQANDDLFVPMAQIIDLGVTPWAIFMIAECSDEDRIDTPQGALVRCGVAYSVMQVSNPATAEDFLQAVIAYGKANPPPASEAIH